MPNAPIPIPKAGAWEPIYADPDGGVGARYHPRVWLKNTAGVWSRLPYFDSTDLSVRMFIKAEIEPGVFAWAFGSYEGGSYPDEPVPTSVWIRR